MKTPYRAGRKKHPVQILKPVRTEDKFGQEIKTYEVVVDLCWAGIEEFSQAKGREYNHDVDRFVGTHRVIIDYYDIESDWIIRRLEGNKRDFMILTIRNHDMLDFQLELNVETVNEI